MSIIRALNSYWLLKKFYVPRPTPISYHYYCYSFRKNVKRQIICWDLETIIILFYTVQGYSKALSKTIIDPIHINSVIGVSARSPEEYLFDPNWNQISWLPIIVFNIVVTSLKNIYHNYKSCQSGPNCMPIRIIWLHTSIQNSWTS